MIDNLPENVASYAMHVIRFKSDSEVHEMVNQITADEKVCSEWKLTAHEYFIAVETAYFYPKSVNTTTH